MADSSVNCPLPRDGRTWIALIFFILLGGMMLLIGLYFFLSTLIWAIGIVLIAVVFVFMCILMFCPKCLKACTCGANNEKEHSYEGSCRYANDPEAARSRKRRRQRRRRSSSSSSSDDSEYERERRRRKRRRRERRRRDSDDSYDDIRYEDEKRKRKAARESDDNDVNEKRKRWMPACVKPRRGSDSDSGLDVP